MERHINILVVEDSEDDAILLLHELHKSGYLVCFERVETPQGMSEALDRGGWDIIIADYLMPQFSAPAALMMVKRYELDLPFIIVSGKIGEDTAVEALKAGAHDFIVKGNLARLVPAIERELREAIVRRERKKADEALRKLSSAVEQTADAVIITSREGRIEYINSAFERLTGYSSDEVIDRTPQFLKSGAHPEAFYHELWSTILNGEVYRKEVVNRKKSGELYYQEEIITPIRDNKGVISHFVSTGRDVTERKRAEEKISHQLQRLAALRDIDKTITTSLDLNVTISVIIEQIMRQLHVDAAMVMQLDKLHHQFRPLAAKGFVNIATSALTVREGEGYPSIACSEKRIYHMPHLADCRSVDERLADFSAKEGFVSYFAVPLLNSGEIAGILEIYHRSQLKPDMEWLHFLETLAEQATIAIGNATLFADLQRSNSELALAYDTTLEGWSHALDLRDQETEGHTQRVTELTMRLAEIMGYPEEDMIHLRRGALLHDIGKMGIPDSILLKPGALSPAEWDIMRRHPIYAYELLSPISFLRSALDIPHYHHEKWDGSGYPHGLQGEDIPLAARIFSVVDVWDALCSDRPYRKGWPMDKVLQYIRDNAGSHFDPAVVDAFLSLSF